MRSLFSVSLVLGLFLSPMAWAGVFNTSHFVEPSEFAIGLEPEFTLSNGSGFGGNLRYTHGVSDISNLSVILGNGGGDRKFRLGGNFTFDFFPDVKKQPGIGIALQGMYYRFMNLAQIELTAIPYVHKSFYSGNSEFEPYVALPVGMTFTDGEYRSVMTLSMGSLFKASEKLRYVAEVGISINNASSYIAGGIVYYH